MHQGTGSRKKREVAQQGGQKGVVKGQGPHPQEDFKVVGQLGPLP